MQGYISSIEPMGLVDGPGLRFVVFMQGCKLRCLYCHNPETWKLNEGQKITTNELLEKILRYKSYYKNGGVTFSGGEPLLQKDFLVDILKKCKENNLHTALDTAGVGIGNYEEILKYVDLVILDIKAINKDEYQKITGSQIDEFNKFLDILIKLDKKLWVRSVIVPGINDNKEYILKLKEFISKIPNIQKVELLPYHLYGISKYKELNLEYTLNNIGPMEIDRLKELEKYLK